MGFFEDYGEGAGQLADAGLSAFRGIMDYRMAASQHKFNQAMQLREQQLREQEMRARQAMDDINKQASQLELIEKQRQIKNREDALKFFQSVGAGSSGQEKPIPKGFPKLGLNEGETVESKSYIDRQNLEQLTFLARKQREAFGRVSPYIEKRVKELSLSEDEQKQVLLARKILENEAYISGKEKEAVGTNNETNLRVKASTVALDILSDKSSLTREQKEQNAKDLAMGRPLTYPLKNFDINKFFELTDAIANRWLGVEAQKGEGGNEGFDPARMFRKRGVFQQGPISE